MLRSSVVRTAATPDRDTLGVLLRHYAGAGAPLSCEPVAEGLLNHGYFLATTRGRYFLKHHLDGDRAALTRQHRATHRLAALGLPVAPPVADADGRTVTVLDGRCYALHPWVEGRHLGGAALTRGQSRRLGGLLGSSTPLWRRSWPTSRIRRGRPARTPAPTRERTFETIEELLALARAPGRAPASTSSPSTVCWSAGPCWRSTRTTGRRPGAQPRGWVPATSTR